MLLFFLIQVQPALNFFRKYSKDRVSYRFIELKLWVKK